MSKLKAVILAAGKGTRMKSDLPKVVHKVLGKTLVEYVIEATEQAGAEEVCLVIGYQGDVVKRSIPQGPQFVIQEEQLGTGHAVKCARNFIGIQGETLVLCGDTPLIKGDTLKELVDFHRKNKNAITVISAKMDDPTGYGRIIRDEKGAFIKSVEQKDATDQECKSEEINSGMYIFDSQELSEALDQLTTSNAQGEYYLPDTLTIVKEKGLKVDAYVIENVSEIAGINTKEQLEDAEEVMKNR